MPTLVVRHPDGSETEHELSGELSIGRQEGCDLLLTEGGVSRRHARVFTQGPKVLVEDLGSANGTMVDGALISGPTALGPQGVAQVGAYELRLKAVRARPSRPAMDAEASPRSTRSIPSAKGPSSGGAKRPAGGASGGGAGGAGAPVLRGLTGPWANKTWPIKGKLVVGRTAPAQVLIDDDSVSRKHAEVEMTPRGAVLKDLKSANGTLVNGEPVGAAPVTLSSGDVIQFGVVEVAVEGELLAAPVRKDRTGVAHKALRTEAPAGGGKKKLLLVAVAGLVLVLGGGGVVAMMGAEQGGGGGGEPEPIAGTGGEDSVLPSDAQGRVQQLLSQCRSYASDEMGAQPQWAKALEACQKALDIDPIHTEANTLIRRVQVEKEAFDFFTQGQRAMERNREDEALDSFRKIPKDSMYFRRARPKAREAMAQLQKRALEDCRRYLRDRVYSAAVPRCERYMGYWCQNLPKEELEPPIGFTIKLEGPLRRNEWRPKDKLLLEFLIARQKLDKYAVPWTCPVADIFFEDDRPVNPRVAVEAAFKQTFPNKYLFAAMMDYWDGRGNEALVTLQKLRNNYETEHSKYHLQADELIRSVGTVHNLYNQGQTFLAQNEVEKAADSFREVLEVDQKLMGELYETKLSFYRRSTLQDFASKAYDQGRHWTDREDSRRGCKFWKLGFSFYAGNPTLNKAVGFCSTQGARVLNEAGSCEDLNRVLDYAVKGDGLEEKVVAKKTELGC